MATLERAIAIAASAHAGQVDRAGHPYILHPLRIMMRLETIDERIVGILHDVVEDTAWTLEQLQAEGFAAHLLEALECVTKRAGEDYMEFVSRSVHNPLARAVKLADLEDNMNIMRLSEIRDKDLERMRRYHQAWLLLRGA